MHTAKLLPLLAMIPVVGCTSLNGGSFDTNSIDLGKTNCDIRTGCNPPAPKDVIPPEDDTNTDDKKLLRQDIGGWSTRVAHIRQENSYNGDIDTTKAGNTINIHSSSSNGIDVAEQTQKDKFDLKLTTYKEDGNVDHVLDNSVTLPPSQRLDVFDDKTDYDIYYDDAIKAVLCCDLRGNQYQYTQMGFIDITNKNNPKIRDENGYHLFYRGFNPSHEIPTMLKATYAGDWNYTAAYEKTLGGSSQKYGPGGLGDKHNLQAGGGFYKDLIDPNKTTKAEFEADFATKKLDGKLKYNDVEVYSLAADIKGNRFVGSASSEVKGNSEVEAYRHFQHDSSDLQGSFYGDKAAELGGAFTVDKSNDSHIGDKELAVVFIGKRDTSHDTEVDSETLRDGYVLKTATNEDSRFQVSPLSVSNSDVLVLDDGQGGSITLHLPEMVGSSMGDAKYSNEGTIKYAKCCDNLKYFNQLAVYRATAQQTDLLLITQGQRTPVAELPSTGKALYLGNWMSYAQDNNNPDNPTIHDLTGNKNNSQFAGAARFDIDFGSKLIEGQLVRDSELDKMGDIRNPNNNIFNLTGAIKGNGFAGTVAMKNALPHWDTGNANKPLPIATREINNFKGGFYGPAANELGGHFTSKDEVIGVTFGAKKQAIE